MKTESGTNPNIRKNSLSISLIQRNRFLLTLLSSHDNIIGLVDSGAMAERLKALVLKTSDTERYRGFESLSLRQP